MTAEQGIATFPGVSAVLSASYSCGHGITPGVATLTTPPQAGFSTAVGDLTFQFGATGITLPGCRVNLISQTRGRNGLRWTLKLQDRRWKWQFGSIFGIYNVRQADGTLDAATEKTPQQLATLLLQAMGETGGLVTDLPNDTRPEVDWQGVNPARELAELCDSLGCRVVYDPVSDSVRLAVLGSGAALPSGATLNDSFTFDATARPDVVRVVTGPRVYESKLLLEAIGVESDGSLQAIDSLSYAPTAMGSETPWARTHPDGFESIADQEERQLAKKSVFRKFRIVGQAHDPETFAPWGFDGGVSISQRWQLLPLYKTLTQTETGSDGVPVAIAPWVEGVFWNGGEQYENTPEGTRVPVRFTLDLDQGIVEFSRPVFAIETTTEGTRLTAPPTLSLVCAYPIRHPDERLALRDQRERTYGSLGTGPLVLLRGDLVRVIRAVYDTQNVSQVTSLEDNLVAVQQEADRYLDAYELGFQDPEAVDLAYAGLVLISLDGAIQQVSWSIGPQGTITRASRNSEHDLALPTYADRRRREVTSLPAIAERQQREQALRRRTRGLRE